MFPTAPSRKIRRLCDDRTHNNVCDVMIHTVDHACVVVSVGMFVLTVVLVVVQSRLSQHALTARCMNIRSRSCNNDVDTREKA